MTIGIDLSSLQGAHRMRGIGYTLINFINNIATEDRKKHNFVFFYYQGLPYEDPLPMLNLDGLRYETRSLQQPKRIALALPGKLRLLVRLLNQFLSLKEVYLGDARLSNLGGIDIFLQTDQMVSLPGGRGIKKAFIAYDVIPYVLEWDYLWNYRTARNHMLPFQAAIRCAWRRWLYIHKLRINARRANTILSISDVTKRDFIKNVPQSKSKIITVPLGINVSTSNSTDEPDMHRYIASSWGYLKKPYVFSTSTPYLLFVGGADKRRRLDDLVTAFNLLRARGYEFNLVLAGDSMQGPLNISTETIQTTLNNSSYLDDIIFMGFVDDSQRDWLYKHAKAFVFPSKYEGFGLPVLEAMGHGTPVVSYQVAAVPEVAGDCPIYVKDMPGLAAAMKECLELDEQALKHIESRNVAQAKKWQWSNTSKQIIAAITDN